MTKSKFGTKDEKVLKEIAKAMADIGTESGLNGVAIPEIDPDFLKLQVPKAPWLSYLEGAGVSTDTKAWEVKYYEKDRNTTSEFINQTDNIPEFVKSEFPEYSAEMKLIVYPIEIGDFVTQSDTRIDIAQDEIDDGLLDIASNKNSTLFNGSGSATDKNFKGFLNQVTTNVHDVNSQPLSKKMIDEAAQAVIDSNGAVSHLVTTPQVHSLLGDLLYPGVRNVNLTEMTLGYQVMSYMTPSGIQVPIVVDPEISKDGVHKIGFVDNSSLRIKNLLPPTVVDLAKLKLSDSKVLVTATTFYNRAEHQNAILTNIDVDAGVATP